MGSTLGRGVLVEHGINRTMDRYLGEIACTYRWDQGLERADVRGRRWQIQEGRAMSTWWATWFPERDTAFQQARQPGQMVEPGAPGSSGSNTQQLRADLPDYSWCHLHAADAGPGPLSASSKLDLGAAALDIWLDTEPDLPGPTRSSNWAGTDLDEVLKGQSGSGWVTYSNSAGIRLSQLGLGTAEGPPQHLAVPLRAMFRMHHRWWKTVASSGPKLGGKSTGKPQAP